MEIDVAERRRHCSVPMLRSQENRGVSSSWLVAWRQPQCERHLVLVLAWLSLSDNPS